MKNEKLNKLKEDILKVDCIGIGCDECPLKIKNSPCELNKFRDLTKERFKNFKPEKCPNCGKELD